MVKCDSDGKECLQDRRLKFDLWVREIPWRRESLSTPVFLPREFHGQGSLAGYSPWGCKESNTTKELSGGGLVAESCPTLATPRTVVTPWTLATPWIFVSSNSKFIGCPVNNLSRYQLSSTYFIIHTTFIKIYRRLVIFEIKGSVKNT